MVCRRVNLMAEERQIGVTPCGRIIAAHGNPAISTLFCHRVAEQSSDQQNNRIE
jgi:hypothetical protein